MDKGQAKAFLRQLFKDINHQDNRCTRAPYYFAIRDYVKVFRGSDGGEHGVWHDSCETEIEAGYFSEYSDEEIEFVKDYYEIEDDTDEESEEYKKYISLLEDRYEFESWMQNEVGFSYATYDYDEVYHNCFLTEKSAKQFLKSNKHHYSNRADTYVHHFWRNTEIRDLLRAASTLAEIEYKE